MRSAFKKFLSAIYTIVAGQWIQNYYEKNSQETVFYRSCWLSSLCTGLLVLFSWLSGYFNKSQMEWNFEYFLVSCGGFFYAVANLFRNEYADKFKNIDCKFEELAKKEIPRSKVFFDKNSSEDITDSVNLNYLNFCFDAVLFKLDTHRSFAETVDWVFFTFEYANEKSIEQIKTLKKFPEKYRELEIAFNKRRSQNDYIEQYFKWKCEFICKQSEEEDQRTNTRIRELLTAIKLAIIESAQTLPNKNEIEFIVSKIDPQIADVIAIKKTAA